MLRRMAANKVIKCETFPTGIADWFMLPSTRGLQESKYKHEVGAADLFGAYYPFLRDQSGAWGYEPAILKDRADRAMRLFGKTFYFEVDRGTESPREIADKLDNYIRYSRETGERFHVIFAVMDSKKDTAQNRGKKLLPLMVAKERNNQFLLASHERLVNDPLGKVLFSPMNQLYSLEDVI